jgi:hypothetical protein
VDDDIAMGLSDDAFANHLRELAAKHHRRSNLGGGSAAGDTGGAASVDANTGTGGVEGGSDENVTGGSDIAGTRAFATSPAEPLTKDQLQAFVDSALAAVGDDDAKKRAQAEAEGAAKDTPGGNTGDKAKDDIPPKRKLRTRGTEDSASSSGRYPKRANPAKPYKPSM